MDGFSEALRDHPHHPSHKRSVRKQIDTPPQLKHQSEFKFFILLFFMNSIFCKNKNKNKNKNKKNKNKKNKKNKKKNKNKKNKKNKNKKNKKNKNKKNKKNN